MAKDKKLIDNFENDIEEIFNTKIKPVIAYDDTLNDLHKTEFEAKSELIRDTLHTRFMRYTIKDSDHDSYDIHFSIILELAQKDPIFFKALLEYVNKYHIK